MAKLKKRYKKTRRVGKWDVTDGMITLECFCGQIRKIPSEEGRDSDDVLDEQAIGWYTASNGICMCNICVIERKVDATGMTERIHGP